MLHLDGPNDSTTFTDDSDNGHTVVANNSANITTDQSQFGGAAGDFTPTSAQIRINTDGVADQFFLGTSDFTIDTWVRFSDTGDSGFATWSTGADNFVSWAKVGGNMRFEVESDGTTLVAIAETWAPNADQWYHIALSKSSNRVMMFVDGATLGAITIDADPVPGFGNLNVPVGRVAGGGGNVILDGWVDEFRFTKGIARFTENFTVPTIAYESLAIQTQFEYELKIRTDNQIIWEVSSSGTATDGSVVASSFGSTSTSTWYNIQAWHNATGNLIGVSVNLHANSLAYTSGVFPGSTAVVVGGVSNGASGFFLDGKVDDTGYWKHVLTESNRIQLYNVGNGNSYEDGVSQEAWASFDYGAGGTSTTRWLMAAVGTGIYASSNLGVTWVNVATDRTATYQSFERSLNILVATSEARDNPLRWLGSGGSVTSMNILNTSAPLVKYAINFQGFLVLLNSEEFRRGFYYEDQNSQLTGDWNQGGENFFELPSSFDDEITGAFTLRKRLYVSTKFKLFRVTFVGGNPDWSFLEVKNFGFVPRTVKKVVVEGVGEVAIGLDFDEKLRLFDGSDDKIISLPIENKVPLPPENRYTLSPLLPDQVGADATTVFWYFPKFRIVLTSSLKSTCSCGMPLTS